jgi:murein L,D-transpeptidase YcbB/YkuD
MAAMRLALLLAACLLTAVPALAQAPSEVLRLRVEDLHEAATKTVRGARLLQADAVVHFFEARGFAPAWTPPAIDDVIGAIAAVELDGLTPAEYHQRTLTALRAEPASPQRDADLQILAADAVAGLLDHVRYGRVRPVTLDRRWNVNPREGTATPQQLLAEVAAAPSARAAIEALKPAHFIYTGLKQALARQRAQAAAGGWPAVASGPTLKPGSSDARVAAVRKRLAATGEWAGPTDGAVYDDTLVQVVFQEHHRLTADGVIGPATLAALNVAAAARVDQIRVNLERARWVLGGLSDTFVLVNLPAFKVYLIRDRKHVWETRAQVGRAGRQTPSFRANMQYLVFNPDWTVPPTILANDVIAAMRRGDNAVKRKGLTILDRQGRRVPADAIDWATASARNFPYVLRQPPGPDNALGRVKFIFPNEHTIFLHDTPSRELFTADERTFSSGCIRIENPLDLATLLLEGQGEWSRATIDRAVEKGETETVFLEQPIPVLIVYWTVSVGATGDLRYARDVYNLDAPVLRALNAGR